LRVPSIKRKLFTNYETYKRKKKTILTPGERGGIVR